MKVKELIEKLKELPQDLDVYVEADHGQLPETCQGAEVYVNQEGDNDYYAESVVPLGADIEEWDISQEEYDNNPRLVVVYA